MQTKPAPIVKRVENISCNEPALSEFNHLFVGDSVDGKARYFDATRYVERNRIDVSPEDFFVKYEFPIMSLVSAYGIEKDRMAIRNLEGHLLIDTGLIFLFLAYTNPDFLAHMNDRIEELFYRGFCVSDSYLYCKAKDRITPEALVNGIQKG